MWADFCASILRPLASQNNVGTVNSNVYFAIRTPASGFAFGLAYVGGACTTWVPSKSAIQEWEHSDLITARVNLEPTVIYRIVYRLKDV